MLKALIVICLLMIGGMIALIKFTYPKTRGHRKNQYFDSVDELARRQR